MTVMEAEALVVESKRRKRKQNQEELVVYYADGISESDLKLFAAFLSWRYGIKERTYSVDNADIIVVAREEDAYAVDSQGKLVLIAQDRSLSKAIADQIFRVVSEVPKIFVPPVDNNWLINKLRTICRFVDSRELESKLYELELAQSNFARARELRFMVRAELVKAINEADYVVIVDGASPLHTIACSIACVIGKPVIAQVRSPVVAAFADIAVARQEDLIAVVSSLVNP